MISTLRQPASASAYSWAAMWSGWVGVSHLLHVALFAVHQTDKPRRAVDPNIPQHTKQTVDLISQRRNTGTVTARGSPNDPELLRELLWHRIHRRKCLPVTLGDRQTIATAVEHTYGTRPMPWG